MMHDPGRGMLKCLAAGARFIRRTPLPFVLLLSMIALSPTPPDRIDLVAVQIPVGAEAREDPGIASSILDRYVIGSRIVRLDGADGQAVNLTEDFAAACDPDISFDGKTIIFSGKRSASDPWHIWRMHADGSGKEQISSDEGDHLMPVHAGNRFYLNDPAPTPQIIYAASTNGWRNRLTGDPEFSLYAMDTKGEVVRQITFNLYSDLEPDVLPDVPR